MLKYHALYVRVSTEAQAEEGFSIDAQKERLQGYCTAMGWSHTEFFIDGGYSGSHLDRPAMNTMITAIHRGEVETVLVYKLDRLSRSQKDTLYLIEDIFLPQNVDFVSLNESIDTSTPYGRAMIGILSAFAQLERENIYLRTRMGMLERVKQGYWMGGGTTPYGYDYDKEQGILVLNPYESEVVRQIYDLYIKGLSPQKIADKLGLSYDRLVTQILNRRSNLGIITYKGKEYQGRHEGIISPDIFQQAQQQREKRQRSPRSGGVHLLTGLIFCKFCGNRLRYVKWGKAGYKLRCYSLDKSKAYMSNGKHCSAPTVWAEEVESLVESDLLQLSVDLQENREVFSSPESILEKEIQQQEQKLRRYYQLYGEQVDDTLLALIEESRERLDKLKESLRQEQESALQEEQWYALRNRICRLGEGWDSLNLEEKQQIYRDCIERVEIYNQEIEIYYTFQLKE